MKKIKSKKGFTLVEMLACTVTLLLVGLICTTGMNLATKSYEESVLESNIQNLEATLDLYIGDILRHATLDADDVNAQSEVLSFTNAAYQMFDGKIKVSDDGYLVCTSIHNNGKETLLVGRNAYAEILYIKDFSLKYDRSTGVFEGQYTIGNTLNDSLRVCEFAYRTITQ